MPADASHAGIRPRPVARRIVARIVLAVVALALATVLHRLSDPFVAGPDDFAAFWSSSRLYAAGQNAYDASALLELERTANWRKDHAYRVWEPPWALLLMAPLAGLPYQPARALWFAITLVILVVCADQLWRVYGRDPARRGLVWLVAATFAPAIIGWKTGQMAILVLAGLVAFLALERRGRPASAVVALILLASVKPHLIALVWLGLIPWMVARRQWKIAGAALLAGATVLLLPQAFHPESLRQFLTAMSSAPPTQPAPTLGTLLRLGWTVLDGNPPYAVVLVPTLAAALWLMRRWHRHGTSWVWSDEMPWLVLVSMVCAPFAWIYDAVILLLPVTQLLAPAPAHPGHRRRLLWAHGVLNVSVLALNVADVHPFWYVWFPPAMLALYAAAIPAPTIAGAEG